MKTVRLILVVCLILPLSLLTAVEAPSGPRAALLIGNEKYEGFTLKGVPQSLDRVEAALKKDGYSIVRMQDLNFDGQKKAVEAFAKSVPSNGVAFFYFIGLGANLERQGKQYNLLRPVKEKIQSDNDYRSRSLNVPDLIKTFNTLSGARVNLLFLDACWKSPILPEKGKISGGLRAFEPEGDTLVMFGAGSLKLQPVPQGNTPSVMATALAQNLSRLEVSLKEMTDAVPSATEQGWAGGVTGGGIGKQLNLPRTETLREGKSAGEGFVNSAGMSFRWCPPGSFNMGSTRVNSAATRDRKPVKVTLTKGFWMGEHEVTQREYNLVTRKNPPIGFTRHRNAPHWGLTELKNIDDFCRKLTDLDRKAGTLPSGWEYVAPTEAQWEYACRAGSDSAFCFGDDPAKLGRYGNFADTSLRKANANYYWAESRADDGVGEALASVGSYLPNAWGLRDMHGNVAELVADHLVTERLGGKDPLVRVEKDGRNQVRGGAWCSTAEYCESTFRNGFTGNNKYNHIGFRIALQKVK